MNNTLNNTPIANDKCISISPERFSNESCSDIEEAVDALSAVETLGDLHSSAHEGHQGFEGINETHIAGIGSAIELLARRTSKIIGESPLAP